MDRIAFIKACIEQGKDRESVRRELISLGESTSGLEAEYAALVAELHIPEPKAPVPSFVTQTANQFVPVVAPVSVPSVFTCMWYGVRLGFSQWKTILYSSVLLLLPSVLFALLPPALHVPLVLVFFAVFNVLVSVVVFGAFLYTLLSADGGGVPYPDALSWGVGRFFSLLWLFFMYSCLLFGATLLFVIPALFVSVYITFTLYAYVKEDARGTRALLRSYDLVKGNFVKVSLVLLLLSIFGIALSAIGSVFLLLPIPFVGMGLFTLTQMCGAAVGLGSLSALYGAYVAQKPLFDLSAYNGLKWFYRLCILIGFLGAGALGFMAITTNPTLLQNIPMGEVTESVVQERSTQIQMNVLTTVTKSKVEATAASAKLYRGRTGFYDGVCDGITVVSPVECRNSTEYFVVYAPISPDAYYCVDSAQFSGIVASPKSTSCQ